jgi:hypothetical protein
LKFYLGTHETAWLERTDHPLFISHVRLAMRNGALPRARGRWALDSGAFSELAQHGRWRISPTDYAGIVARYAEEIGGLDWAAPMDWMCEPHMVERTGLTVEEHQHRTVENYCELVGQGPFIPVLQGWTLADYERCLELYREHEVSLARCELVGIGSVCRRQSTRDVGKIVSMLASAGLRLHGFGVKRLGLERYGPQLASADSMAWSARARNAPPLPGHRHSHCGNCLDFALQWRAETVRRIEARRQWLELPLDADGAGGLSVRAAA